MVRSYQNNEVIIALNNSNYDDTIEICCRRSNYVAVFANQKIKAKNKKLKIILKANCCELYINQLDCSYELEHEIYQAMIQGGSYD